MNNIILIDANSIGFAGFNGGKLTSGSLETQAIFNFVRGLRSIANNYQGAEIIVLWDGDSKQNFRYKLYPDYKGGKRRSPEMLKMKESYKAQVPKIKEFVNALGIRQITSAPHEADDLAGLLVKKFASDNVIIRLITRDWDWSQLVKKNVVWHNQTDKKMINIDNFEEVTGYKTPLAFLQGKALQGDSSDNINGVGGIGEKGAIKLLNEWSSVNELLKQFKSGEFTPKTKSVQNLVSPQGINIYNRNLRLMQLLRPELPLSSSYTSQDKGKFDIDKFKDLCGSCAFMSILNDLEDFLSPFNATVSK